MAKCINNLLRFWYQNLKQFSFPATDVRFATRLTAEDNPEDYSTEPHPYISGALMLAHKPNGDCINLK